MPRAPSTHLAIRPDPEARRKADASRHRASAERRGTAAERGYDGHWQKSRLGFLKRHPLCCCCLASGRTVPALVVDHVVPHKGDRRLFWDRGNWQALCQGCHLGVKARLERRWMLGEIDAAMLRLEAGVRDGGSDGHTGADAGRVWRSQGGVDWHPSFLMPSLVPLHIVCGAPLAGKSRFVETHKGARDLVIDVDRIASDMAGTEMHDWPIEVLSEAGRERNRMLAALADRTALRWSAAWLIVSEPEAEWRTWWHRRMQPARIVVIETPADVCKARASVDRHDPTRAITGIADWWHRYTRRDGDVIIDGR